MNYLLHLLVYFDIYAIVALSLNLVVGYCGLLTLAHAGYYAMGSYACALLMLTAGWGFLPAMLAGALLSAVASLAVSLPAWRLRGDFLVLASLAVQTLIYSALYNWSSAEDPLGSWKNLTNGPFGLTGIPRPRLFGWEISETLSYAVFASGLAGLCGFMLWRLKSSPWGRLLLAMREDELAARGLGKNTRFAKVQAFAIASAMAAVAGSLYAAYVRYLAPSSAMFSHEIMCIHTTRPWSQFYIHP